MDTSRRTFLKMAAIGSMVAGVGLAGCGSGQSSADSLLENLRNGQTLKVASYSQAPWGYMASNGDILGLEPAVARAVAEEMGIENIEFELLAFDGMIPGVTAGRFDMFIGSVYIRPDRCDQVAFANPHVRVGESILTMEGNPYNLHSYEDMIANEEVTIGTATTGVEPDILLAMGLPESRLSRFPDAPSALAGLTADRVQVIAYSAGTILGLVNNNPDAPVEIATPFAQPTDPETGEVQYGFPAAGFGNSSTELRDAWNEALNQVRDSGKLEELLVEAGLGAEAVPSPDDTAERLCAS